MDYPKWLYHATEEARIVANEEEHSSLGAGWHEEPVEHDQESENKPRRGRPPKVAPQ